MGRAVLGCTQLSCRPLTISLPGHKYVSSALSRPRSISAVTTSGFKTDPGAALRFSSPRPCFRMVILLSAIRRSSTTASRAAAPSALARRAQKSLRPGRIWELTPLFPASKLIRDCMPLRSLVFLFLSLQFAPAQISSVTGAPNQPPSGNRYKVTGTVINSITGEPIPKALVTGPGVHGFTSADGKFEASGVPEGPVFFSAQRPGFFNPGASLSFGRPPKPTLINANNTSVQVKLAPASEIHGRVLDNNGEPIEGMQVQLFTRMMANGLYRWRPAGSAVTDESGAYLFEDQMGEIYIVQTRLHRLYSQSPDLVINDQHFPELYPATYYPNAPDRDSAQPIKLAPGTQAEADFALTSVPGYSISGTVAGASRASVFCQNSSGEMISGGAQNNPRTGAFTITGVPSGPCSLVARVFGRGASKASGEIDVNIPSSDISGIQIPLNGPLPDIPIVISGQPADLNGPGVQFSLSPKDLFSSPMFRGGGTFVKTRPGENGEQQLIIQNPEPGSYHVSAMGLGNACVASVTSGSTDLTKEDLVISPDSPSPPIAVALRTDCGSLEVHLEGGEANTYASIVMLGGAQSPRMQMAMVGSNTNLSNLAPGEYKLYAFDDISNIEYGNPEALKNFEAQQVTIGPGEKATVQVKLLKTSGSSNP